MLRHTLWLGTTACVLAAGYFFTGPAGAARPEHASVVELFTSQGCSSCPPADALLETLARDPNVIAVSLPVDYWDNLGWKDTFAKPAFSARQRAYASARGDRQVYTPQAVVNGRQHTIGSSRSDIAEAIAQTAREVTVPVTLQRSGERVAVLIGADAGKAGTIIAVPYLDRREVAIGRGENARTRVVYTNIAREIVVLGAYTGSKVDVTVPAAVLAGADGVIVLVQPVVDGNPGQVIGAARLALK